MKPPTRCCEIPTLRCIGCLVDAEAHPVSRLRLSEAKDRLGGRLKLLFDIGVLYVIYGEAARRIGQYVEMQPKGENFGGGM